MSWELPEQRWEFLVGDDPPGGLPVAWVSASRAVTADLGCRRGGRPIGFRNVMWTILADQGLVSLGFALAGEADVDAYHRCRGYRLMTTAAQASAWLAGEIQEELAGYEFVQWPILGERILQPRIIDEDAWWVDPATDIVIAHIGDLCRG